MRSGSGIRFAVIGGSVLLLLWLSLHGTVGEASAQSAEEYARQVLERMPPEERVGQLFLVTFRGTEVGETSEIYDLIVRYHVGGVILLAANDNFTAPDTLRNAHALIAALQTVKANASALSGSDDQGQRSDSPVYVPLWIGILQEGNGAPTDQILSDLTPLPSLMALGATWQPALAEQVGTIAGEELAALGFNLFLGPSLDVLDQPRPASGGDLGTRVFGGDPFWVGEMGQAYVRGLHRGSQNRLAVISKHFPGHGSSDRPLQEEVSTVRKSLEQLKQIELAPFMAVTGNAPDPDSVTDGLLVSHIRYQGFQGNIRATTRPVSFDAQALGEILKLPPFAAWRAGGGLMVSDDLGSRAVRNFYAPGNAALNASLVVRDAFLAGNDLLYLGNIYAVEPADHDATVKQVIAYFLQRYREDPAFAERVDAAVLRILAQKYRRYGEFNPDAVTPDPQGLEKIGASSAVVFQVASRAATLVSPDPSELDAVLPEPPGPGENLVFLTDARPMKQCSTCPEQTMPAVDALQQAVLRLYGSSAGGLASPQRLSSFSLNDLNDWLNNPTAGALEQALRRAQWVVISIADNSAGQAALIRRFLTERQDVLRFKKVILFSFGAPYYFDSTDISRLTAFFAFYSKTPPFLDVAARVLYQELNPEGASPVSVPGIGYDLIRVTSPDPDQIIPLLLDVPALLTPTPAGTLTPEPTAIPSVRLGDTIPVRTGVIVDHNGHPVPDGTVVRFLMTISSEGGTFSQQQEATTVNGSASASFRIEKAGLVEIRATSEPALQSEVLQLNVREDVAAIVTVIVPAPTETPIPTPTLLTPTPLSNPFVADDGSPRLAGWFLSLVVSGGGALLAGWLGHMLGTPRWGRRWGLCALIGGLVIYNYLALGLPGSAPLLQARGGFALMGLTLVGAVIGTLGGWIWMKREEKG